MNAQAGRDLGRRCEWLYTYEKTPRTMVLIDQADSVYRPACISDSFTHHHHIITLLTYGACGISQQNTIARSIYSVTLHLNTSNINTFERMNQHPVNKLVRVCEEDPSRDSHSSLPHLGMPKPQQILVDSKLEILFIALVVFALTSALCIVILFGTRSRSPTRTREAEDGQRSISFVKTWDLPRGFRDSSPVTFVRYHSRSLAQGFQQQLGNFTSAAPSTSLANQLRRLSLENLMTFSTRGSSQDANYDSCGDHLELPAHSPVSVTGRMDELVKQAGNRKRSRHGESPRNSSWE